MTEVPDFVARAIRAQGKMTVEEVVARIDDPGALDAPHPVDTASTENGGRVPESGLRCVECGRDVDPTSSTTLREVIGWAQPRPQGGQNHVRFRRETGRLMCQPCAHLLAAGVSPSQERLIA